MSCINCCNVYEPDYWHVVFVCFLERASVISNDITKASGGINLMQVSFPQRLHCCGITVAYRRLIQCDQPFVSAE